MSRYTATLLMPAAQHFCQAESQTTFIPNYLPERNTLLSAAAPDLKSYWHRLEMKARSISAASFV